MRRSWGRLIAAIACALVVLAALGAGGLALTGHVRFGQLGARAAPTPASVKVPPLPTPYPVTAVYYNDYAAYSLHYPAGWQLVESDGGATVRIFILPPLSSPNSLALQIHCAGNPQGLNPEEYWKATAPKDGSETPVGLASLGNGLSAYEAQGTGQVPYLVFVLVNPAHVQAACVVVSPQLDDLSAAESQQVMNSFTWL